MKFTTAILLFAMAFAQDEAADPAPAEEPAAEEEASAVKGGDLVWESSGSLEGSAGTFSTAVTYEEDADGVWHVTAAASGEFGIAANNNNRWKDENNNTYKNYRGGIMLSFANSKESTDEAGETVVTTMQEGFWAIGQRGSEGNNSGVISGELGFVNFADAADENWAWIGVPPTDDDSTATTVWTDGSLTWDEDVAANPDYWTGVTASAKRPAAGDYVSFKNGETTTIWGGVWLSKKEGSDLVGGGWGKTTHTWDMPPPPVVEEVVEVVEEGASSLAVTALAGVAVLALF